MPIVPKVMKGKVAIKYFFKEEIFDKKKNGGVYCSKQNFNKNNFLCTIISIQFNSITPPPL